MVDETRGIVRGGVQRRMTGYFTGTRTTMVSVKIRRDLNLEV